jgi:tRNA threonylcarbamoyl adenosine modification protein YeaZ
MSQLIIENSTLHGTLAVMEGAEVLWKADFSKAGEMAAATQKGVSEASSIDEIIVGIGPGSYTGLRVACALAIGLSLSLGCPAFGCPSVLGYHEKSYRVVGDARRGSVFLAEIKQSKLVREPELLSLEKFYLLLPEFTDLPLFAVGPIPERERLPVILPEARYLAAHRSSYRASIEPLYLKEPHITGGVNS